jgi:hypothetical protein
VEPVVLRPALVRVVLGIEVVDARSGSGSPPPTNDGPKPVEDAVAWGLETDAETMLATQYAPGLTPEESRALCRRVRCPVLVIHGDSDAIASVSRGAAFAEQTGGNLVVLEGSGHAPHLRDPVKVNLLLRDFVVPAKPARRWIRGNHGGSARSISPPRSGSATPSAMRRSPTSCASCIPTSRSTGSRSTP